MNAKEQMQAMIDGKSIMCDKDKYRLDENGDLVVWIDNYTHGYWDKSSENFVFDDANYIVDESKCVDFAHALGRMAQGKVMRCLWSGELFRIAEGTLQTCNDDNWQSIVKGELLEDDEMESLWMEVEE
ncbi:MAG: hypothetical protein IJX35_00270 [Candidatus Methanomethylophilaceae archaeon]|nr:hypothetical protein [Candidatus Methanomethylophilaceae archaeon]